MTIYYILISYTIRGEEQFNHIKFLLSQTETMKKETHCRFTCETWRINAFYNSQAKIK